MNGMLRIRGALVLDPVEAVPCEAEVVVREGRIESVGPEADGPGEVVDARDRLLIPGLVNGHTHSHGALAKGRVGDRWHLETFLAANATLNAGRSLHEKHVSARLAAVELIRRGCTTAMDLFVELPGPTAEGLRAVADAYRAVGLRAVVAPMLADRTLLQAIPELREAVPASVRPAGSDSADPEPTALLAAVAAAIDAPGVVGGTVSTGIAPTIPMHCSDAFLRGCVALATERGLPLQTHVAESALQAASARARYGRSIVAHLEALGALGPRTSLAHGIWLDDDDLPRLAGAGTSVIHNPGSNLRLGSGIADVRRLLDAGVPVGVGTDASNTSDGQNAFEAMRLAATLSRVLRSDAGGWISAAEAFRMATVGSARALGLAGQVGRIAPGFRADLVMLDLSHVTYQPLGDALLQMVFGESGAAIDTVIVDGRIVLRAGRFTTVDEAALRREVATAAASLEARTRRPLDAGRPLRDAIATFCCGWTRHRADGPRHPSFRE